VIEIGFPNEDGPILISDPHAEEVLFHLLETRRALASMSDALGETREDRERFRSLARRAVPLFEAEVDAWVDSGATPETLRIAELRAWLADYAKATELPF
jgi:hypothetical protein